MNSELAQKGKILIVGGGLSGALFALKLKSAGFENFELIEATDLTDHMQTWSAHEADLSSEDFAWLQAMGAKVWSQHRVKFKTYDRVLPGAYLSLGSECFFNYVKSKLGRQLRLETSVKKISINGDVTLDSNETLEASLIVDARGQADYGPMGYQKFVGLDLQLNHDHGLTLPIVMDATVPQKEGYRFIYVLPWSETRLLVEDTRYTRNAIIDDKDFMDSLKEYIEPRWGPETQVIRKEVGVLPIPLTTKMFGDSRGRVVSIGLKGGFFHPVTSYSLPWALRVSDIAKQNIHKGTSEVNKEILQMQKKWQKRCRFLFQLNRMMFGAAEDSKRVKIFERFYGLSWPLIQRFYQGDLKFRDQARILMGKPPVPIGAAIKSLVRDSWM